MTSDRSAGACQCDTGFVAVTRTGSLKPVACEPLVPVSASGNKARTTLAIVLSVVLGTAALLVCTALFYYRPEVSRKLMGSSLTRQFIIDGGDFKAFFSDYDGRLQPLMNPSAEVLLSADSYVSLRGNRVSLRVVGYTGQMGRDSMRHEARALLEPTDAEAADMAPLGSADGPSNSQVGLDGNFRGGSLEASNSSPNFTSNRGASERTLGGDSKRTSPPPDGPGNADGGIPTNQPRWESGSAGGEFKSASAVSIPSLVRVTCDTGVYDPNASPSFNAHVAAAAAAAASASSASEPNAQQKRGQLPPLQWDSRSSSLSGGQGWPGAPGSPPRESSLVGTRSSPKLMSAGASAHMRQQSVSALPPPRAAFSGSRLLSITVPQPEGDGSIVQSPPASAPSALQPAMLLSHTQSRAPPPPRAAMSTGRLRLPSQSDGSLLPSPTIRSAGAALQRGTAPFSGRLWLMPPAEAGGASSPKLSSPSAITPSSAALIASGAFSSTNGRPHLVPHRGLSGGRLPRQGDEAWAVNSQPAQHDGGGSGALPVRRVQSSTVAVRKTPATWAGGEIPMPQGHSQAGSLPAGNGGRPLTADPVPLSRRESARVSVRISATRRGKGTRPLTGRSKALDWELSNLKAVAALRHPCVLAVFGVSEVAGRQVVVEEFMAYGNLSGLLTITAVPLEFETVSRVALCIASGCRYLQEQQPPIAAVLHPDRILVDAFFTAKVRGHTGGAQAPSKTCARSSFRWYLMRGYCWRGGLPRHTKHLF